MTTSSKHLSAILAKQNRTANLQVVFLDIEKYSKRRTQGQIAVIDSFTECLRTSILEISKHYIDYAQNRDINFQQDIITLPTGDGAAVVFTFDGLHDIHLSFAINVLKAALDRSDSVPCERFSRDGWCNCHSYFNLRVGVSEGKGILYTDVRGNYNVAGGVVNSAARVMGLADRNQIMFTEDAYKQIVDMVDDSLFSERFREYSQLRIKHDLRINVFQYLDASLPFLNSNSAAKPEAEVRMTSAMKRMRDAGTPFAFPQSLENAPPEDLAEKMEKMADFAIAMNRTMSSICAATVLPATNQLTERPVIDADTKARPERE